VHYHCSMVISITEQRELADYIARKMCAAASAIPQQEAASIVWDAIEDYTASDYDNGPDILTASKAAAEDRDSGNADDFRDNYFTRSN